VTTKVSNSVAKQPRYPFPFIQADALRPPVRLADFDFVWASPPCQHYTNTWKGQDDKRSLYPDHVQATRDLLAGHPRTVIENVPGAPVKASVVLTGAHFGLPIVRVRMFECRGFSVPLRLSSPHRGTVTNGDLACVVGHGANRGRSMGNWSTLDAALRGRLSARNCRIGWMDAMGIDWMTRGEMAQAIPPAYAEYIGRAALGGMRDAG
jgi:DNA (cytosine-5)-methyltransferase 1